MSRRRRERTFSGSDWFGTVMRTATKDQAVSSAFPTARCRAAQPHDGAKRRRRPAAACSERGNNSGCTLLFLVAPELNAAIAATPVALASAVVLRAIVTDPGRPKPAAAGRASCPVPGGHWHWQLARDERHREYEVCLRRRQVSNWAEASAGRCHDRRCSCAVPRAPNDVGLRSACRRPPGALGPKPQAQRAIRPGPSLATARLLCRVRRRACVPSGGYSAIRPQARPATARNTSCHRCLAVDHRPLRSKRNVQTEPYSSLRHGRP